MVEIVATAATAATGVIAMARRSVRRRHRDIADNANRHLRQPLVGPFEPRRNRSETTVHATHHKQIHRSFSHQLYATWHFAFVHSIIGFRLSSGCWQIHNRTATTIKTTSQRKAIVFQYLSVTFLQRILRASGRILSSSLHCFNSFLTGSNEIY